MIGYFIYNYINMWFWPKEIKFSDIFVNSFWSLLAWFIWSMIIVIITFLSSSLIQIPNDFWSFGSWIKVNTIFPIMMSLITFVWTSVSVFLTYLLLTLTNPEKYKRNSTILWQISLFWILLYIFITPIYIYVWVFSDSAYILMVFLIHVILLNFWTSILLEVLNNYRYVLLWIYWSFFWLFFSLLFTSFVLSIFSSTWTAQLFLLLSLLPLTNFIITFLKQTFELVYYNYNKYTNMDQLWDIFYQIEVEEKEKLRQV